MSAHVGHAAIPPVAGSIDLDWSDDALADLDRFAAFLQEQSPELAAIVAEEIIARAQLLSRHPKLGRPISTREEYRQIVMQVLGGTYVFQYRYDGNRIVMFARLPRPRSALSDVAALDLALSQDLVIYRGSPGGITSRNQNT